MPTPSDPTGSCGRLADYLYANKDGLLEKWLIEARNDVTVLCDKLSLTELTDHMPVLFDTVVEELRDQCGHTKRDVQDITARHTVIRWLQDYDLRAVLREVSLLRTEFIHLMLTFEARKVDSDVERLLHSTIIHRILDDIVFDAAETYLMLKNRAVDDR